MSEQSSPKIGLVVKMIISQIVFFFVLILMLGMVSYNYQKNILMEQFFSNSKTIVQIYAMACADAKEARDDLMLLAYIERMKKLPDIVKAMVIDKDLKVQMHTEKAEIGKVLQTDSIAVRVVTSGDFMVQTYKGIGGDYYAFSMPILVEMKKVAFLRMDFSSHSIGMIMDSFREKAVLAVILMLILVAIGVYAVSISFGRGIHELSMLSEIISTEKFDDVSSQKIAQRKDEIGSLAKVLFNTMQTVKSNYASYKEKITYNQRRFNDFLRSIGQYFSKGVMFLDQDNKVTYINAAACNILMTAADDNLGKHILEITRNAEFMESLSVSSTKPNQMTTMEITSLKTSVAVTTVQEESTNEIVGTIIVFY